MYKNTHREIARAIRSASEVSGLSDEQTLEITKALADVCQQATPSKANFDREVFEAIATQKSQSR